MPAQISCWPGSMSRFDPYMGGNTWLPRFGSGDTLGKVSRRGFCSKEGGNVTGLARKGLGKLSAKTPSSKARDSVDFYLVRCRRTGQGCRGIRCHVSCMIFHSFFPSSLSIRDKLVESSSASCKYTPETVTDGVFHSMVDELLLLLLTN